MAFFAEKMKAFTDEVATCARERAEALTGLGQHTEQLLSDARSFLKRLDEEHQALATQVRSTLSSNRRDRSEHVKVMRRDICNNLQQMRATLQETLFQSRSHRQEKLGQLFGDFQKTREQLNSDLREAGRIWRNRARR